MSRTSIPLDSETKARLDESKRDDETWDEFLLRIVAATGDGMSPGTLSADEAEDAMEIVREGRDRYCFSTPRPSSPTSEATSGR